MLHNLALFADLNGSENQARWDATMKRLTAGPRIDQTV